MQREPPSENRETPYEDRGVVTVLLLPFLTRYNTEKIIGGPGRTRTCNQPVMSRTL